MILSRIPSFTTLIILTLFTYCADDETRDPITFKVTCTGGDFTATASIDADPTFSFSGQDIGNYSYEFYSGYYQELYLDYLEISATRNIETSSLAIRVYRDNTLVEEASLEGATSGTEETVQMSLQLIYTYGEGSLSSDDEYEDEDD